MDLYHHADDKVVYCVENMPGPSENSDEYRLILEKFNSQLSNCLCGPRCSPNCSCIIKSGGVNYLRNRDVQILNEKTFDGSTSYPLIECNDGCSCDHTCVNRYIQRGPLNCLYLKECGPKGFGLFTNESISTGMFICEYAGEVLTLTEANKRHQFNLQKSKMNYILCLNEYSNNTATRTIVDPSVIGNIGRYINHSCEPNSHIIPVRVDSLIPKLAVFALHDIEKHEEITFNYGPYELEDHVLGDVVRTKCFCNSSKCKGWMPYHKY